MIIEKPATKKDEFIVYFGMKSDDWNNLIDTLNNQDYPLRGNSIFYEIIDDLNNLRPHMEKRIIEMQNWIKTEDKMMLIRIPGEITSVCRCESCGIFVFSSEEIPHEKCLTCGKKMKEVTKNDRK